MADVTLDITGVSGTGYRGSLGFRFTLGLSGNKATTALEALCTLAILVTYITGNEAVCKIQPIPDGWTGMHISPSLPITYRESWTPPIPKYSTVKGTTLTNLEIDANFKVLQDAMVYWIDSVQWARDIINTRYLNIVDIFNIYGKPQGDYQQTTDPFTNVVSMPGYGFNTYTLQQDQSYNTLLRFFNTTPASLIIPSDSVYAFPIGTAVLVSWNGGAFGTVDVITDGNGVALVSPDTCTIARPNGKIVVIKTAPNIWELEGNLAVDPTV